MFMSSLLHVINVEAAVYFVYTMDQGESGGFYSTILGGGLLSVVLVGSSSPSQFYAKNWCIFFFSSVMQLVIMPLVDYNFIICCSLLQG